MRQIIRKMEEQIVGKEYWDENGAMIGVDGMKNGL